MARRHERDGDLAPAGEVLAGALAASRRRQRRGDDVFDREAGTHAAVVARRPAAVLDTGLGERVLPVAPQEVLVEPGRQVIPGEDLVLGAVAMDVPVERQALGLHRPLPATEVEALAPF